MMTGLFDRYFQLLAGRLPAAEHSRDRESGRGEWYGVIADSAEDEVTTEGMEMPKGCLC
jgi:hypothetical protein